MAAVKEDFYAIAAKHPILTHLKSDKNHWWGIKKNLIFTPEKWRGHWGIYKLFTFYIEKNKWFKKYNVEQL